MMGPGKYGDETEALLQQLGAKGVLLLVLDGNKGHGMSFSYEWTFDVAALSAELAKLPALLRRVADTIERDGQP